MTQLGKGDGLFKEKAVWKDAREIWGSTEFDKQLHRICEVIEEKAVWNVVI